MTITTVISPEAAFIVGEKTENHHINLRGKHTHDLLLTFSDGFIYPIRQISSETTLSLVGWKVVEDGDMLTIVSPDDPYFILVLGMASEWCKPLTKH